MQNGANAIQALITKEIMATTKHFYLDEDDDRWNFFYQIMGDYFDEKEREFYIGIHPQGIWWNSDGQEIVHVGQDASNYKSDDKHQMQYIIDVTFQEVGIRRQTVAWVLSQNIKVALNGVNPIYNILCEQIAQKLGLVNDTHDPISDPIGEPTPVITHIIDAQICDGV